MAVNLAHQCATMEMNASKADCAVDLEKETSFLKEEFAEEWCLKEGAISKVKFAMDKATNFPPNFRSARCHSRATERILEKPKRRLQLLPKRRRRHSKKGMRHSKRGMRLRSRRQRRWSLFKRLSNSPGLLRSTAWQSSSRFMATWSCSFARSNRSSRWIERRDFRPS